MKLWVKSALFFAFLWLTAHCIFGQVITGVYPGQRAWAGQACTVWKPIDIQFGSNTYSGSIYIPASFLTCANNADGANLTLSGYGQLDDRNVGTRTMSQYSLGLGGSAADKYGLTLPISVTIYPKALAVTGITANNKTYDGTTTATISGTASLYGSESGGAGTRSDGEWYSSDSIGIAGTPVGTFASTNIGTGITVTITGMYLTGTGTNNYSLTVTRTANITAP